MTLVRTYTFFALCCVAVFAFAEETPRLTVTSPTLKHGEAMPTVHTPDGRNDSPELHWSDLPKSIASRVKSYAVVCEDPDAGNPPPFVHWLVYNIPASAKRLPGKLPIDGSAIPVEISGAVQGLSGFRRAIYRGPAPPPGKVHHYHFIVYALDTSVATSKDQPPLTRSQLSEAVREHVIAQGEIVSTYERK